MNCVGNTGKKDVIYKGRRIGEGENYMLDKDGNYIDSITDNTKEISELQKQLKELLSKGDENNDNLTKQFAEVQDKINQSVDKKLQALEKVMNGSMEKTAAQSAMNIKTAVYAKDRTITTTIKMSPIHSGFSGDYYCRLDEEPKEVLEKLYKPSSDNVIGWLPLFMTVYGKEKNKTKKYSISTYETGVNSITEGHGWKHKGEEIVVTNQYGTINKSTAQNVIFTVREYFQSQIKAAMIGK